MEEFRAFISNMELTDLQVLGSLFTWVQPNGKACSRLDRTLLSEDLINRWEVLAQKVGSRDLSDHKPVWTKSCKTEWAPKAFRVLNCWFDHKDFIPFVHKEWSSLVIKGRNAFVLKEKMRLIRARITWGN